MLLTQNLFLPFWSTLQIQTIMTYLEHTVVNGQEGHIEGATTQIVDDDVLLDLLVEAVRDRGGGRLVDDTEDVQTSDGTGILRNIII